MNQTWISTQRGRLIVGAAVVAALLVIGFSLLSTDSPNNAGGQPAAVPSAPESSASSSPDGQAEQPSGGEPSDGQPSDPGPADGDAATPPPPGSLDVVDVDPLVVKKPVGLEDVGRFGTGLAVKVVSTKAVAGEAQVQGQIAGPAVRVVLQAKNNTDEPISLARAQVEVTYGEDEAPGVALSGPNLKPFPASVAPGETVRGAFVYGVPKKERDQVQIVVFYATDAPIVVFEGSVP